MRRISRSPLLCDSTVKLHAELLTPKSMSEGNGSNLQALMDATASGRLLGEISLVISNRLHAKGLQRAQNAGIPTTYLNLIPYSKRFPTSDASIKYGSEAREAYDTDLASKVLEVKPDMVVCAGK